MQYTTLSLRRSGEGKRVRRLVINLKLLWFYVSHSSVMLQINSERVMVLNEWKMLAFNQRPGRSKLLYSFLKPMPS